MIRATDNYSSRLTSLKECLKKFVIIRSGNKDTLTSVAKPVQISSSHFYNINLGIW